MSNENLYWKTLSSRVLLESPWLKVTQESCGLPNGKIIDDFYTLWQPDWVLIMAEDVDGMWLMVRQYRHGTGKMEIEFPAGIVDTGEDSVEAGKRELQEECAHGDGNWAWLRSLPVNPDRHKGCFHIVRATNVLRQGKTSWDDSEHIELFKATTAQIRTMIGEGLITHPHHIAAFYLASL